MKRRGDSLSHLVNFAEMESRDPDSKLSGFSLLEAPAMSTTATFENYTVYDH